MKQRLLKFSSVFLSVFMCVCLCCNNVFAAEKDIKSIEEMHEMFCSQLGNYDLSNYYYVYNHSDPNEDTDTFYTTLRIIRAFTMDVPLAWLCIPSGNGGYTSCYYAKIDGEIVKYNDKVTMDSCEWDSYSKLFRYYHYSTYNKDAKGKRTNIPIFSNEQDIENYLNTGSLDGLSNKDSYFNESSYDEVAPHVENAYLTYSYVNNDSLNALAVYLNFTFPEGSDGYVANVYSKTIYDINKIGYFDTKIRETRKYTTLLRLGCNIKYQSSAVHYSYPYGNENDGTLNDLTLSLIDEVKNSDVYKKFDSEVGIGYKLDIQNYGYIFLIQLDNGKKKGDYVRLTINRDGIVSTEVTSGKNSMGATEETAGGTVDIVDGTGNADDVINGGGSVNDSYDVDSTIKPGDNVLGSDDVWSAIKDMFGLDGIKGVIDMLGSVFGFIPKPVIILLTGTVGAVCAVIIVKFIRG